MPLLNKIRFQLSKKVPRVPTWLLNELNQVQLYLQRMYGEIHEIQ